MDNFLQRTWEKLTNFFHVLIQEKDKEEIKNPYSGVPDPSAVFRETLGMNGIDRDEDIPKNLQKIIVEIEHMGDRLRKLGESDGPFQMRDTIMKSIAQNTAERTSAYIETIFKGLKEGLSTKKEVKEKELENASADVDEFKETLKTLRTARNWNPKNYSRWAWMYLIFGMFLLAADAALSLNVTEIGFQLRENWEIWAMSAGITACTIFIKIYYDDFILPSLERSATQFQNENLPKIQPDLKNKFVVLFTWSIRFILKSGLLIFLLYTIFLLGQLRIEVAGKVTGIQYSPSAKASFVYLSLLFPVIGGVCMAIAIHKFRSLGVLRMARRAYKRALKVQFKAQKELSNCEQDYENCESYIHRFTDPIFIEKLQNFLFSCYQHGYEYAFRKHNAQMDVVQKAKEIRRLFVGDTARLRMLPDHNNTSN